MAQLIKSTGCFSKSPVRFLAPTWSFTTICNAIPRRSDSPLWPSWVLLTCGAQASTPTHRTIKSKQYNWVINSRKYLTRLVLLSWLLNGKHLNVSYTRWIHWGFPLRIGTERDVWGVRSGNLFLMSLWNTDLSTSQSFPAWSTDMSN